MNLISSFIRQVIYLVNMQLTFCGKNATLKAY